MAKTSVRPDSPKSPERRRVLGLAAASVAALGAPSVARAQGPTVWKLATGWPKESRVGTGAVTRLAESLAAMSGGRLTLQPFAEGDLATAAGVFDAVAAGSAEAGHALAATGTVRDPAFHFFAGVPFGLTGHEHAAWLRFGGGQALWRRAYDPFGVVPFYAGAIGVPGAGWFRNPLAVPSDLANVAMATSGLSAEVWRRLGANPAAVAPSGMVEAYTAQKIDAAESQGLWRDSELGLANLSARLYAPGFRAPGPSIEFIVNRKALEALDDELQAVVRAAAAMSAAETYAEFAYNNAAAYAVLRERNVTVEELPEPIVRAAGREVKSLLEELASASPIAAETYESFVAFRRKAAAYSVDGDEAALRIRTLGLTG